MKTREDKRKRMREIVDIINNNSISSQGDLANELRKRGFHVAQATLSRDLKSMRLSKMADDDGNYIYRIPAASDLHEMPSHPRPTTETITEVGRGTYGVKSVDFSQNLAVIKTRTGYAAGLAHDIDMSHVPQLLGTVAGTDTIIVVFREGISRFEAEETMKRLIPQDDFPF